MKLIDALTLAQFILGTYPNKKITPLKLQKLAYYAKVWSLVARYPVIDAPFEKWMYGPVNSAIYSAYKEYGSNIIPDQSGEYNVIKGQEKNILVFILNNYVDYSAFDLSAMTHRELPWLQTTQGQLISDQAIVDYYAAQPFANNFSEGAISDGPFHVLQTESWHAFTLDMQPDDVKSMETFPSYAAYTSQSKQAMLEFDSLMETLFDEQSPS